MGPVFDFISKIPYEHWVGAHCLILAFLIGYVVHYELSGGKHKDNERIKDMKEFGYEVENNQNDYIKK